MENKPALWREAKRAGCAPACGYRKATSLQIKEAIAAAGSNARTPGIRISKKSLIASKAPGYDARIEVRLPENEKRDMIRCAAALGHSLSDYIRKLHHIAAAELS